MKRFGKNKTTAITQVPIEPSDMPTPTDVAGFIRRGMAFYARQRHESAASDFKSALALDDQSVDANYGLGLVNKAMRRKEEAVSAFQQVLNLIDRGVIENHDRRAMLHRLALGHMNEITLGDWSLEKEIWKREG